MAVRLVRAPCTVCGAFLRVLSDSLLSFFATLLDPLLGGSVLAVFALLYTFLYHPPALATSARDFFCTVRRPPLRGWPQGLPCLLS